MGVVRKEIGMEETTATEDIRAHFEVHIFGQIQQIAMLHI
jgi:hypothetical protein